MFFCYFVFYLLALQIRPGDAQGKPGARPSRPRGPTDACRRCACAGAACAPAAGRSLQAAAWHSRSCPARCLVHCRSFAGCSTRSLTSKCWMWAAGCAVSRPPERLEGTPRHSSLPRPSQGARTAPLCSHGMRSRALAQPRRPDLPQANQRRCAAPPAGGAHYMARNYGCYVYGIDLSVNMILTALERAAAAGNGDKVRSGGGPGVRGNRIGRGAEGPRHAACMGCGRQPVCAGTPTGGCKRARCHTPRQIGPLGRLHAGPPCWPALHLSPRRPRRRCRLR